MRVPALTGAMAMAAILATMTACTQNHSEPTSSPKCPRSDTRAKARPTESTPLLAAGEEAYLSNVRQLTSQGMGLFNAGEAYFSPGQNMIIFQATPVGRTDYQIYTLNLRNNELKMVSTGRGACTCSYFHPHKPKIIFASSHLDPGLDADGERPIDEKEKGGDYKWKFDEHMDIFEADIDGSNLRRLTDAPGYDAEGTISPDGREIVFTSQRDGDLELYVMNYDGTSQRRLTSGEGYDGGAFFSPDGRTVLYRGDRRNDGHMNLQLRLVNADGSNDRALTDNQVFNWCPYWYPDGRSLIFTQTDHSARRRGETPNYDLFMRTVDDEKLVRITYHEEFDGLPVFSPDGTKLMWTSRRGGIPEPQIFIADFKYPAGELGVR